MNWTITVIGCCGLGWTPAARQALSMAQRIYGAPEWLAALPETRVKPPETGAEKLPLDAAAVARLPEIVAEAQRRHTVILASGDPLCCGIAASLRRYVEPEHLLCLPAPTAFQLLFARIGQPWEGMGFFTMHGKSHPVPWRQILHHDLAVVYGDPRHTSRRLAAQLIECDPASADRPAACGCRLGMDGEYVHRATLREMAGDAQADVALSLLAVLPDRKIPCPPLALGLPDDTYRHAKNMITHPEIRAVALAKLRLSPGVMWDIGAGSGSVGLEAAQLCAGLNVHAVEKHPERCTDIRANALACGVGNHACHNGDFATVAPMLPDPDRVFVGGGGPEIAAILAACFSRLRPGGVLVATGVLAETVAVLNTALKDHRRELLQLQISRAEPLGGGSLMRAENPITLAVFYKP